MTFLDDRLDGRSQHFTFKAKETITIDRATLEHIFSLLNGCSVNLDYLTTNHVFVESTETYLAAQQESLESCKALTLLNIWIQTWPDAREELADGLEEAVQSIKFILAASAGGEND